jgi:hypothetical protein
MRAVILGLVVFALGLATAALVASPRAGAHIVDSLSGSVGPEFSISMSASSVPAGDYTITISDRSNIHNFHLSGPGVNKSTSISGMGTTSWSVTLQPGTYNFQCDAHASTMNGSLTVTGTTTHHTTTQQTTSHATTTEPAPTTIAVTTTTAPATTETQPETTTAATTIATTPARPLKARVAAAHGTRSAVTITVSSSLRGRAVAQLFAGKRRVAHATGTVPGKLVLHPAKALEPGRYLVKLRVAAGGRTTTASRTVTVL